MEHWLSLRIDNASNCVDNFFRNVIIKAKEAPVSVTTFHLLYHVSYIVKKKKKKKKEVSQIMHQRQFSLKR